MSSTVLLSLGLLICTCAATIVTIGQWRRGKKTAPLSKLQLEITLWTAEIDKLKEQNAVQAAQIEDLTERNRVLAETITTVAKVDVLIKRVDTNHRDVVDRLDKLVEVIGGAK